MALSNLRNKNWSKKSLLTILIALLLDLNHKVDKIQQENIERLCMQQLHVFGFTNPKIAVANESVGCADVGNANFGLGWWQKGETKHAKAICEMY